MVDFVQKFAPYLVFHPEEVCFPITQEEYFAQCRCVTDEYREVKSADLYEEYKNGKVVTVQFIDGWREKLRGKSGVAPCYVREFNNGKVFRIVYYYLFSHTEPYKCCMFGCAMPSYAHRADLKFILVDVDIEKSAITRVYFGAHGTQAGQWRDNGKFDEIDGHPIAYAAKNDHSFYYDRGLHPRIFMIAWDECASYVGNIFKSNPMLVYDDKHELFSPIVHGWNYLSSTMNVDGVAPPHKQNFWNVEVPEKSNNWFLRLCCCNYF